MLATIVVVPRERFSMAVASLESIVAGTEPPFELVYVDSGSPHHVARALAALARKHGFRLLRSERYLSPNEARNLGARGATTRYVVFVDNDVLVAPGWLDALVARAETRGAAIVGPLYLLGPPERGIVHMAGGDLAIDQQAGRRWLRERHRSSRRPLRDAAAELEAGPSEECEFHCMLVRREVLERLGPLDERLLSAMEHVDLCLAVAHQGGTIEFEPASVVAYLPPVDAAWTDLPYLLLRWSDGWNRSSLEHFRRKWRITEDDPMIPWQLAWLAERRRAALGRLGRALAAALPARADRCLTAHLTTAIGLLVTHRARRARRVARREAVSRAQRRAGSASTLTASNGML